MRRRAAADRRRGFALDVRHEAEGRDERCERHERPREPATDQHEQADREGERHAKDRSDPGDEDVGGDTVWHVATADRNSGGAPKQRP